MSTVVLDTNILLRLANPAAPEHEVCRNAVTVPADAGNTLATAAQVLVEFWVLATRPTDVNGLGWTPEFTRASTLNTDDFKAIPDLAVRHPTTVTP
jgi:hypothetical protein